MNTHILSTARRLPSHPLAVFLSLSALLVVGCGGSEEATEEEMMSTPQQIIDSLQAENATLAAKMNTLEQENRNLTAQTAELEMKLAEEREKKQAPPRMSKDPMMEYEHGLNLQRQRNYQDAVSVFMGLLQVGAPEGLESNCHYWIGEGYYGMNQYEEAIGHFEQVFNFPRSAKKDDAQLMIANCYARRGDKARAKQEYQKLIDQYPSSPYVQRAKDQLAKM